MVNIDSEGWSSEDNIRILIASDIHLGHQETDAIRGEDSFIAFEEVLSLAVEYDVDLVLLGGDLFDHAKPSPSCMFKCTQIIRKYCLGDKPVNVELLSDQVQNFARNVNYEDPNLNVSYPILSIHGNHDDPVGQGSVSSLDILSISGLVNYFGKWTDYTHVRISPVLLRKGETQLALYGLSHLKDQRLSRLYKEKKVEMQRPDESQDWFNMFVLHQNRADRGPENFIREDVLPSFLDLVVWGHEHDSQIFPMKGVKGENESFTVIQPGSTVATSLAAGEALPKHCALLQICKKEYILTPIPLKTVRPFVFKTVVLSEETLNGDGFNESDKVQDFLKTKVEEAIEESKTQLSGNSKQPKIPLVRLSVFYEKEEQNFNKVRFGQNFSGLVANPQDVLLMKREKKIRERKHQVGNGVDEMAAELGSHAAAASDVESLLRAYYEAQPPEKQLAVLSVAAMTEAVRDFTLKHDEEVFRRVFDAQRCRCVAFLMEAGAETEAEVIEQLRLCKGKLDAADEDEVKNFIETAARKPPAPALSPVVKLSRVVVLSSDDDEPLAVPVRGRGRNARRGAATPRARGRGRNKASPPAPPPLSAPERRTPRRAAQRTTTWLQSIDNSD